MTENEHGDSGSLVNPRQLEAEGVINQASPPRPVMQLESGLLLIFIAVVILLFGSQYIKSGRKAQQATAAYSEGIRLSKDKRWEQAITSFDKAIDNDPSFALAFAGRGDANFRAGHYNKAVHDYNAAIGLNPGLDGAYYGRAFLYMKMQKPQQAIRDFSLAIQFNLRNEWAYLYRGILRRDLGQDEQGIQDMNAAISINSRSAVAYCERGVTYLKQGKDSTARNDFEKARELSSDDMRTREMVDDRIAKAEQEKYERTD